MASKKKTKKKTARKAPVRRLPWHEAFAATIVDRVLDPILISTIKRHPASSATSLAQLHTAFEAEHGCSIPRPLFEAVCKSAGISFSRTITLGGAQSTAPNWIDSQPIPTDGNGAETITRPEGEAPAVTEEDGFKITNDARPSSPRVTRDDVLEQANLDAQMAEAQGLIPEPVIIPNR